ncbi:hypothetical protein M3J09_012709 [Ascochyta lentis]
MDRFTLRQLARRVAFALIVALQLAHFYLVMTYTWTSPRKPHPKMTTMGTFSQLFLITDSFFHITEHNMDVKLGRGLIRGLGIEALFWGVVIWSAGLVGVDVTFNPNSMLSLAQLLVLDVVMWAGMLSSTVALVARSDGAELIVNEKGDELIVDEKRDDKVDEKEEV